VIKYSIGDHKSNAMRAVIAIVSFAIIATAVIVSKRRRVSMGEMPADRDPAQPAEAAAA
jgi:K(+)-stimulated pyrophosphate-energized sodium pump